MMVFTDYIHDNITCFSSQARGGLRGRGGLRARGGRGRGLMSRGGRGGMRIHAEPLDQAMEDALNAMISPEKVLVSYCEASLFLKFPTLSLLILLYDLSCSFFRALHL